MLLIIASYTLLELEPILGPEVPGEFLIDGQQPSQYVRNSLDDYDDDDDDDY